MWQLDRSWISHFKHPFLPTEIEHKVEAELAWLYSEQPHPLTAMAAQRLYSGKEFSMVELAKRPAQWEPLKRLPAFRPLLGDDHREN